MKESSIDYAVFDCERFMIGDSCQYNGWAAGWTVEKAQLDPRQGKSLSLLQNLRFMSDGQPAFPGEEPNCYTAGILKHLSVWDRCIAVFGHCVEN
jgi:hypothetical protein